MSAYITIAASSTDQELKSVGRVGQKGDVIKRLIITSDTATAANVSITDGTLTAIPVTVAATPIGVYIVELDASAKVGPWKVTTGANATVIAVGIFT